MPEVAAHYVDPADLVPEEQITGHLGPDEKLLWAGRPSLALLLRAHDFYLIPLSLVLGGLAVLLDRLAISGPMPVATVIVGSSLRLSIAGAIRLAIAITGSVLSLWAFYLCFVRFFVDIRQRECIFYGVTNKRIIIAYGVFTRRVKSLALDSLSEVSLRERPHGAGSIRFRGKPLWLVLALYILGIPINPALSCFELPGEARRVYELILEARRQTKSKGAELTSTP